ncbi:uncharacterized protein LOC116427663 [Nomia melanderi]|uniref:uncharacterized protein LOC116427663 n=1 Tax=Nomia melanderi TaxID=2448451 RepID=UPI001304434B|nr:uncharacterized protein LOC116427663 [Nomia melanderi]XP_031834125.1 uncharacterized protein LOC116427663 [Nomia melanderi]XP_031834126.1 uncharacterized protein LOC116427663 [Nomia melanderi]
MDVEILKSILNSCETATKDLEKSEDYQKLVNEDKFIPTSSNIFNALCLSFTNLLCYKVSREAYQRYTVRFNVIDVLRDCCRITEAFNNFNVFIDGNQTSTFLRTLLDKYLTNDFLDTCDSTENVLPLSSALISLTSVDSYYKYHVERLLLKLAELSCNAEQSCDESERLLCYAVQKKSNLNLELSTVENIYKSQRCKLIEQPLLYHFMSSCTNLNKDEKCDEIESVNLLDQLIEFISVSPYIFLLVCAFLKELFVHLDHCPIVVSFIQLILHSVKESCENLSKDILDLYPRKFQSIVILLRIEPIYHTDESKHATLRTLRDIHSEDKDTAITLLLHFPQWLKLFGELLSNSDII